MFLQKDEELTKILSAASGTHIIYQLPNQLDIYKLSSFLKEDGRFFFTDNIDFQMDITEIVHHESLKISDRTAERQDRFHVI